MARWSQSISSHGPDEAPGSRFFHLDDKKWPGRALGSSFSPRFGPSTTQPHNHTPPARILDQRIVAVASGSLARAYAERRRTRALAERCKIEWIWPKYQAAARLTLGIGKIPHKSQAATMAETWEDGLFLLLGF
jgi:hypothetical protein